MDIIADIVLDVLFDLLCTAAKGKTTPKGWKIFALCLLSLFFAAIVGFGLYFAFRYLLQDDLATRLGGAVILLCIALLVGLGIRKLQKQIEIRKNERQ